MLRIIISKEMNDLLKSQTHENCKLALPEGLKELMSDISREVLRAQPTDLYQFIADYLGAMLEARETLTIACQVCADVCQCTCDPIEQELYSELKKIGLDEEDLEIAVEVIIKHLKGDTDANEPVKEQSLILKLLRKTRINETQISSIQQAIQKAFKRQKSYHNDLMNFQNSKGNLGFEAAHHTLQLNKQKQPASALQSVNEEVFVAPDFKPCVQTVSSTSLAGSFMQFPKFRPYSAHDSEILSEIPGKEHTSIDYTNIATASEIKSNKKEISFLDDEETEKHVSDFEDLLIEEIDESNGITDDFNDRIQDGRSDDEVREFIEDVESENESSVSSVAELLQNRAVIDD